jgi:CheY-like chemotaxis protein
LRERSFPVLDTNQHLVLVTEDDEDVRTVVQMTLEGAGFEVLTANNGHEALAAVASRMPSVILLDMKMPVMNGWQFASAFRARFYSQAKIVVMSAAEHAPELARQVGADGWLAKPFSWTELIEVVQAQLR